MVIHWNIPFYISIKIICTWWRKPKKLYNSTKDKKQIKITSGNIYWQPKTKSLYSISLLFMDIRTNKQPIETQNLSPLIEANVGFENREMIWYFYLGYQGWSLPDSQGYSKKGKYHMQKALASFRGTLNCS